MRVAVCDFCRKAIPDDAEVMTTIVVAKQPYHQVQLDCCEGCARERGILRNSTSPVPNCGALTPEELAALTQGVP